jgi:hypothetical protein
MVQAGARSNIVLLIMLSYRHQCVVSRRESTAGVYHESIAVLDRVLPETMITPLNAWPVLAWAWLKPMCIMDARWFSR